MEDEKKDFINYDSQDLPKENIAPPPTDFNLHGISSPIIAATAVVIVFLIGIVLWTLSVVFGPRPTQPIQKDTSSQIKIASPSSSISP